MKRAICIFCLLLVFLSSTASGFDVFKENGKVGLDLFRASGADVVVTDLIMPVKEGLETIIELRAQSPDVRILAMSGSDLRRTTEGRLHDAETFGADASLAKPFSVDQLRNAVAELLR